MKTILLTGATGFLGSHLTKALFKKNKIIILKRSFSDTQRIQEILNQIQSYDIDKISLTQIFNENPIHIVIHTATNYGRETSTLTDVLEANLLFPIRILECCLKTHVKTFINTDTALPRDMNPYSLAKKQFLEWLKFYGDPMQIINMKLEYFYGLTEDNKKFVTRIIQKMLRNEDVDLTAGDQKRDFIYISDIVCAYSTMIEQLSKIPSPYFEIEVGSGSSVTIKKFVEKIKNISKSTSLLKFGALPYRRNEVMESTADILPMLKLGWKPTIGLEEGLQKMIAHEKDLLCQKPKN